MKIIVLKEIAAQSASPGLVYPHFEESCKTAVLSRCFSGQSSNTTASNAYSIPSMTRDLQLNHSRNKSTFQRELNDD